MIDEEKDMIINQRMRKRLKTLMDRFDIKNSDLADAIGVNRSNITKYLNGTAMPRRNTLILLSNFFHTSPAWLGGIVENDDNIMAHISKAVPVFDIDSPKSDFNKMCSVSDNRIEYVIIANDESMSGGRIYSGDRIYVSNDTSVIDGAIYLLLASGKHMIRRLYKDSLGITARADNPNYPPIYSKREFSTDFKVLGKIVMVSFEV